MFRLGFNWVKNMDKISGTISTSSTAADRGMMQQRERDKRVWEDDRKRKSVEHTGLDEGSLFRRPTSQKVLGVVNLSLFKPRWVLRWQRGRVDDVATFYPENVGRVPNGILELVDVLGRPFIQVMIARQG